MAMLRTRTRCGDVEGVRGSNLNVTVFKGIPYAEPPLGPARFLPPKPATPWMGTRVCDRFAPASIQGTIPVGIPFGNFFRKEFYPYDPPRSEDSLCLNVWTAAMEPGEKRPVLFWIHGGGLASGFGHEMEFDGEAIAKRGAILVTINYRLGAIGFFAHPELSKRSGTGVSGNNVLLDQLEALRWVRDNIAAFGGDPDNVTVFGQSGGAAATTAHLASPLSKGLLHKAIIQSGVSGHDVHAFGRTTLDDAEAWGVKACEVLGKTVADLEQMPAMELHEALERAPGLGAGRRPSETVDGHFLTVNPREAASSGRLADLPILTGGVSGDGMPGFPLPELQGEPPEVLAAGALFGGFAREFVREHPVGAPENQELYRRIAGARPYFGALTFGERQAECKHRAPYLYYFDAFIPDGDDTGLAGDGVAYHSAELWYVFGTLERCWRNFDGRHYDLSHRMTDYWTNFARTGDPNGAGLPRWEPYTLANRATMRLNEADTSCGTMVDAEVATMLEFTRTHAVSRT